MLMPLMRDIDMLYAAFMLPYCCAMRLMMFFFSCRIRHGRFIMLRHILGHEAIIVYQV